MAKKGMVTDLSSLFPAEEVQKASMRVHDEIAERRRQLEQLEGFFDDNTNLINLVRRLPDETHHNIMVPFGKAAFFPGKMTNPNKFLVLIGEGYYAERSAKQTVEILRRRSKELETQMESLQAIMKDLNLEASFFEKTAHESGEGLVEIREDYVEEAPSGNSSTSGVTVPPIGVDSGEVAVEDDEYARIFARMAELEKEEEEEEAEEANGSDQDGQMQNERDNLASHDSTDQEVRSIQALTREAPAVSKEHSNDVVNKDLERQQDERKYPARNNAVIIEDLELPQDERDHVARKTVANKNLEPPQDGHHPPRSNAVVNKASELPQVEKKPTSPPPPASNTAFTGSIIEHAHNIGANVPQQPASAQSSKPVSRFKMQRK